MTTEQKQKALQLLELCMDVNTVHAEARFECCHKCGFVEVLIYYASNRGGPSDEHYTAFFDRGDWEQISDAAIKAVTTIPERAPAIVAAKEEARRAKIIKEYEELFNK